MPMMLPCPLHVLTGWQCPYCGLQRGLLALTHGRWVEAWAFNPVFWLTLPYLLLLLTGALNICGIRHSTLYRWATNDRTLLSYALGMILWGIIRNL